MPQNTFTGFHTDFLKFLSDLKANNNKDWFDKNRPFYESEIKKTSKSFVYEMGNLFIEKELPFVADSKISLFRINRDVRFSANKNPYKNNISMYFPFSITPETAKKSTPVGLYCHLEPNNCFIAGGFYSPEPSELNHFRNRIFTEFDEFTRIIESKKFKSNFPEILRITEPLKRVPNGFPKDHPSAEFLKLKDLSFTSTVSIELINSSKLLDFIIQKAELIAPFLNFLSTTERN